LRAHQVVHRATTVEFLNSDNVAAQTSLTFDRRRQESTCPERERLEAETISSHHNTSRFRWKFFAGQMLFEASLNLAASLAGRGEKILMDAAAFRIFVREMFPHEKELKSFQARSASARVARSWRCFRETIVSARKCLSKKMPVPPRNSAQFTGLGSDEVE